MKTKCISTKKAIVINIVTVITCTILAIIIHAILPAAVDATKFDSILVKWFGFPAIAMFYFIVLFTQCAIAVGYIGRRTKLSKLQAGIRFGISFAMIYLIGMQEVVIGGSPFSIWGIEFVKYQFIMGVGDGIPAILLCFTITLFTLSNNKSSNEIEKLHVTKKIKAILIIAIGILIGRTIGYESGFITNDTSLYPIECYLWTVLFGLFMGCIYVILYPLLAFEKKHYRIALRFVSTIGANWIIFNCFMGLITKGIMPQMLFRSVVDVVILFVSAIAIDKYIISLRN
ncbi:hypothetical protein [Inconstantimicrobium mannanitabidum]|uniref:Uncharacterized protein n=1 Tax=Inconstantimicrobium mannanitabidum TaxID=1604901 RepID=A0ACB5R7K8_9CLOT|nr:hypothetical protein [Clostridium sp. TW13]GKX64993.1 hypothetical protein rsdtw13_02510 [Clostridium sp. TW13]